MALKLEPGPRLVVATHNPGKVRDLADILENRFELVTAGDLGLAEPDETETTFGGNALVKARAAAEASGRSRRGWGPTSTVPSAPGSAPAALSTSSRIARRAMSPRRSPAPSSPTWRPRPRSPARGNWPRSSWAAARRR